MSAPVTPTASFRDTARLAFASAREIARRGLVEALSAPGASTGEWCMGGSLARHAAGDFTRQAEVATRALYMLDRMTDTDADARRAEFARLYADAGGVGQLV